jgi:hypothetical protein
VDGIIKFFQKLPAPVKTFLNVLGGITAVSGPIIMLAGVMGNFIGYVIKGIFHLKQMAQGGQGFKLLTPEIMAADAAAKGLATSFYSDTEATVVLTNAINTLAASFDNLEIKAQAAKVAVQPGISTVAGGVIAAGGPGQRVVDKNNPLVGDAYTRDMSHMIPAQTGQLGTIFGTVPGASPVNVRIGKNPQAYMNQDLPRIPGVTSVNGISTGVVAQEAAKWHAMTAAIAMQSEAEIKVLKAEVMATGTITSSLSDSYQALLPQFSEITEMAALETQAIVKQLQASKITVDQARAKVIQLNATVEAMLAETTAMTATSMGRTANLTTVPLTSQPVVDPITGKSNMKEMFHKGSTKNLVDRIARALGGVRTSGAGYNIQTTKPKFAKGGIVPGTGDTDTYHTTAEPGSFVINKKSTEQNMPIISKILGGTPTFRNAGGSVPVVLTPGEAVIPANIAQRDPNLMLQLNGGPGNTSGMGRIDGGGIRRQAENNIRSASAYVSRLSVPANFLEENQVRHVMHDAAILNSLGMSEVESLRTSKRLYDEARQYAYDPKTDTINDERMLEIKEKQTRELDKKIGGGLLKEPVKKITRTGVKFDNRNQAIHPSPSLINTLIKMGFANPAEVKRLERELFAGTKWNPKTRKYEPNIHGYATEHDQGAAKYKYSAAGNFGQAQAGNKEQNLWTSTFSNLTKNHDNPFVDRLPQTETEKRMAIDTIGKVLGLGTGPGTEERIIKAPTRLKHNFGITKIFMDFLKSKKPGRRLNQGGQVPGQFAQRLFRGGKAMFLGMPRTIKQVEAQRAAKAAMEKASQAVKDSRFSKTPVTDYDGLLEPTSGRSFPVAGIGGVYARGGEKVFVKPVLDEKAALAELRATEIARDVHGLQTPNQRVVVMRDPTDPTGARRILALESKYNPAIANQDGKFTSDQYFRQLVASALRGDKDLGRGNLSGNILADVGPAGVFATASGPRDYSATMPSFKHQAMVNLLGVKGSNTKRFFAESTSNIPKGMTADQYNDRMLQEINNALPKLKQTISRFDLNAEEKVVYNAMIQRLSDARRQTYGDLHGVHSSLKMSPEKTMTPAAIAKMIAADELKRRQKGHSVSLSDNAFKTEANGFMAGGMIGNILKGKAMHRIGAGFGPTGAPKPSMYESAPWGVNSLSIKMAETLFANTGLRKHTQKLFYDKFAAALAKEKPYGYVKDAQGSLRNALEPDVLDSVIRSAASDMIGDRAVLSQLSPIDKDILRKKFLNWESKKDTPLTDSLKQVIFGLEKREMGGPVNAGQPYVVGEKGPELFVPRNSGGIVPNNQYAAGGMVPNNKYGIGGMIGPMVAAMVAQILGGKVGGMGGTALSTLGGIIPFMMMGGGAGGKQRPEGFTYADATSNRKAGPITSRMGKTGSYLAQSLPISSKAALHADKLAASGSKLAPMFGRIALMATRANLVIGGFSLAIAMGLKRMKDHNEHLRVGVTQYGLTEEAAKKAGLKFTDYNSKLVDTAKNIEAIRERNQFLYESMQDAGLPISMTIEEYKKLKKEAKEVYGDQIKLINQSKESDLPQVAIDIKTALMAAGLSADEASKKIFAMFKLSDQAEKAGAFTVGNRAFRNIKTGQDAAEAAVNNYVPASAEGGREGAAAVSTGLNAINAGIIDMIEKSKKAAKADKTGNTKVLTEYQAQEAMLQKLNKLEASKAVLTAQTRAEMIKQNPELKKIINPLDTVVSLFEKMNLAAKGFTGDLSKLGAEAVSTLSRIADSVSASTIEANKGGVLEKNYAHLKKLTDQQKVLMAAAKGQSAQKQIDTRNELKRLQDQINANNKLADARLKALDAAKQEGDIGREIAKKQAEYDAAIATGNTAGAQQASLDMEGLQSNLQYNSQKKAIEDALKLANAPLEAKIKSINDGQQKLSDNAAIAAQSLSKLNAEIAKEKGKIDDVNQAMTTLAINAIAAGMTLKEYLGTDAGKQDSARLVTDVNTAAPGAIKPKQATHPKARLTPASVTDQALGVMGGVNDAVTKGLATKGIKVDSMTGDIIINGKKMDVKGTANTEFKASRGDPGVKSVTVGKGSAAKTVMTIDSMSLHAQGIDTSTGSVFTQGTQKYRILGIDNAYLRTLKVEKAGYGTMKLNPKIPTIVGDRGPEMAFGGMVIPNMASIPYSSPRYDVGQAAKMFEPMSGGNAGGNVINLTQNIYPSEGMNTDAFVRQVVSMTKNAIGQDAKLNAKMVGNPMNVSIKT